MAHCLKRGGSFVYAIIELLLADPDATLHNIASTAYAQTLEPYHKWAVKTAVKAGKTLIGFNTHPTLNNISGMPL